MDKAQLPVLMSIMMITQAVLSTPCGLRAKRSLKERNRLLLAGFGAMIIADLLFAKLGTPQGDLFDGTWDVAALQCAAECDKMKVFLRLIIADPRFAKLGTQQGRLRSCVKPPTAHMLALTYAMRFVAVND